MLQLVHMESLRALGLASRGLQEEEDNVAFYELYGKPGGVQNAYFAAAGTSQRICVPEGTLPCLVACCSITAMQMQSTFRDCECKSSVSNLSDDLCIYAATEHEQEGLRLLALEVAATAARGRIWQRECFTLTSSAVARCTSYTRVDKQQYVSTGLSKPVEYVRD